MKMKIEFPLVALVLFSGILWQFFDSDGLALADNGATGSRLPQNAPGVVSLIAGNTDGAGAKDGIGVVAQFSHARVDLLTPKGIASDEFNNLYVADAGNHTIRRISPDGVVTTIAGKAGVHGSVDGPGSEARFYYPSGIAVDVQHNLYVSDTENRTIRKITPDGVVSTLAGVAGVTGHVDGIGSAARFGKPKGITVTDKGIVFVADSSNSAVRMIAPDGTVTTVSDHNAPGFFSEGASSLFDHPGDVMFYPSTGEVFVADTGHNAIRVIRAKSVATWLGGHHGDIDGKIADAHINSPIGLGLDGTGIYVTTSRDIRKIGNKGLVSIVAGQRKQWGYHEDGPGSAAQFSQIGNVATDKLGNAYVADGTGIRKIDSTGLVSTFAGQYEKIGQDDIGGSHPYDTPEVLIADSHWNLYVTERSSPIIHKIESETVLGLQAGHVTIFAGRHASEGSGYIDGPSRIAKLGDTAGLAADNAGNFYATDRENNVIRKIDRNGTISTIAGMAGHNGVADGTARRARFDKPSRMVVNKSGDLFVVDQNGKCIRKVSKAGVVTTFAGNVNRSTDQLDGVGADASFRALRALSIDQSGNLFVLDDSLIRKISPTGAVSTLGNFSDKDADGDVIPPWDLVVDGLGDLYFAFDTTVRKLTPRGEVFTVAGILGRHGNDLGATGVLDNPHGLTMLDNKTLALISGNAILKVEFP